MNHREPPHQAAGIRRALRYVSLLLLPALAPKSVSGGHSRTGSNAGAVLNLRSAEPVLLPYLAVLGPPPLRFAAASPPPDLTVRPAAAAPLVPTSATTDSTPAPAASVEPKSTPSLAANSASIESPASADHAAPSPTKAPPPSILPDDARPAIRPEDFLPYFQIPGQPGGVNLLVPVPRDAPGSAPLPPSSATYTQSK
jgi:hypothetical protein